MIVSVILAAGQGKRMNSELPKPLCPFRGKPMICSAINAAIQLNSSKIIVVVGYKGDLVKYALNSLYDNLVFSTQDKQLGTGHAVMSSFPELFSDPAPDHVLIMCSDHPLIDASILEQFVAYHKRENKSASVLTLLLDNPTGYGRIIRGRDNQFSTTVEEKDIVREEDRLINEVSSGFIIVDATVLERVLPEIGSDNAQGEYYLPDILKLIPSDKIGLFISPDVLPFIGVNTAEQLQELEQKI